MATLKTEPQYSVSLTQIQLLEGTYFSHCILWTERLRSRDIKDLPKTTGELVRDAERKHGSLDPQFIPFPTAHVCSLPQEGRGKA